MTGTTSVRLETRSGPIRSSGPAVDPLRGERVRRRSPYLGTPLATTPCTELKTEISEVVALERHNDRVRTGDLFQWQSSSSRAFTYGLCYSADKALVPPMSPSGSSTPAVWFEIRLTRAMIASSSAMQPMPSSTR